MPIANKFVLVFKITRSSLYDKMSITEYGKMQKRKSGTNKYQEIEGIWQDPGSFRWNNLPQKVGTKM